jgi:hypothetical protein
MPRMKQSESKKSSLTPRELSHDHEAGGIGSAGGWNLRECAPKRRIEGQDVVGGWGPCVVRGPVDGRSIVWWVIDNIMWTDSWLGIAGAGCGLTRVGAGEEQARKVVAGEAS